MNCQAGGFGASWWRAGRTAAMENVNALTQNSKLSSRSICPCLMSLWGWRGCDLPITGQSCLVPKRWERFRLKTPGSMLCSMWDLRAQPISPAWCKWHGNVSVPLAFCSPCWPLWTSSKANHWCEAWQPHTAQAALSLQLQTKVCSCVLLWTF